jgi:hypothetical protein
MLLAVCLGEQPLVLEGRGTTAYLYIECSSDDTFGPLYMFTVFDDGEEITTFRDIVTAITACFIMCWVFDKKIPKAILWYAVTARRIYLPQKQCSGHKKGAEFFNQI